MEERVPTEEIVATVERMEARLSLDKDPLARQLMSYYFELKPRFLADLHDPRDVALANASALMLVQQAIGSRASVHARGLARRQQAHQENAMELAMATGRILLVDDDVAIREGVAEGLAFEGYRTEGVSNGQEALEWLDREGPPAMVLLDLLMPVMNGAQLLERLRADSRWAGVPAVLMSAAIPTREALSRADAYLAKPFDLEEVLAAVARWCGPPGGAVPPGSPAGAPGDPGGPDLAS